MISQRYRSNSNLRVSRTFSFKLDRQHLCMHDADSRFARRRCGWSVEHGELVIVDSCTSLIFSVYWAGGRAALVSAALFACKCIQPASLSSREPRGFQFHLNRPSEPFSDASKMSKFLLVADSNVANNLQHQATIGKGQFDFKKCTTKGLFSDKILAAQSELVVVAGIDCIVNEALSAPRESERCVSFVLNHLVTKIIEKLEDEDSVTKTIALASPLYWNDFSEEVKRALASSFIHR